MKNYKLFIASLLLPLTTHAAQDLAIHQEPNFHPIYMGVETGYGSTTWGYLVPAEEDAAMAFSTPTAVHEGGVIWGLLLGYEFSPNFAIEGSYTRYPNAEIEFDDMSLFAFEHDDVTEFSTETESVSLIGKFMLYLPNTKIRAVSSVGIANVHRADFIFNSWTLNPKFGVGFNYSLNQHVVAEVGITYTAGYAVTELSPAENFIPFLYSGYLHLTWHF